MSKWALRITLECSRADAECAEGCQGSPVVSKWAARLSERGVLYALCFKRGDHSLCKRANCATWDPHILKNMLLGLKAMVPSQNGICCLNLYYRRRRSDSQREIKSTNSFLEELVTVNATRSIIVADSVFQVGWEGMTGPFLLQNRSILSQETDQLSMCTWCDWVGRYSFT
jgi:hypothetical protein